MMNWRKTSGSILKSLLFVNVLLSVTVTAIAAACQIMW
jgi:hypothetical protein